MFDNFSNPTPEWSTASEFPLWTPARKFPLDHLVIGNKNGNSKKLLSMERGLYTERDELWRKLREDDPFKWTASNFKDEL